MTAGSFTLTAAPGTDVWRKPPHTNVFNVPTSTSVQSIQLSRFKSARVSFSFPWTERYDQAGLLLSLRRKQPDSASAARAAIPEKWIKTGVEFYSGKPMVGTVACDSWADWSLAPLAGAATTAGAADGTTWTTVSIEKSEDEHGLSLWAYQVLDDGRKAPLREVCWVYDGGMAEAANWDLDVAAFAARPAKAAKDALEAHFRGFEVQSL